MSSPSKNRWVIAYPDPSNLINLYQCGDCRYFFPSLQTIHGHFKSCASNTNPPSFQNESRLDESPGELTARRSGTSNSLLEGTVSQDDYEDITEIAIYNDRPVLSSVSSFCNSESRLDSKDAYTPLLSTMPDGTSLGHSGNRKQTYFDEQDDPSFRNESRQDELTANRSGTSSSLLEGTVCQDDYEDITEIAVSSNTPGLSSVSSFCNSECRLDSKDENSPLSSTMPDCTSLAQSGNRKQKSFDEHDPPLSRNDSRLDESPDELVANRSGTSSSLLEGTISQNDYDDITEIAVSSNTLWLSSVSSFCNSECRLDSKDADTPFSSTMPDGTSLGHPGDRKRKYCDEQGLSGIRKRKHFGEQNCSTGFSHRVPISYTMANAHSSEKCHELDTKNIVNEDSIHEKSVIRDSDVKENAATFSPLLRELLTESQIALKNSHTLLPVRQSNFENDNEDQIINVGCLDKKDEKIAKINYEPIKLGADTDCTSIEDTNTSVRELMTAKHSEPSSSLLEGAVAQDDDDDYEDITEIAVYNDTPGLSSVNSFCNSECRLDNKDADTPFSSTIADGTSLGQHGNRKRKYFDEQGQSGIRKQNNFDEQGLSGIRKRKNFGEQNCSTGFSHRVPISYTMANAHSAEKCHELDTKNIVNEDSIHEKSVIRDSDVKENAATFSPLLRELLTESQIDTLLPVRQSNFENDNEDQIIDVGCLDKKDEKIAKINYEPIKLGADTDCTSIEDTNTSVRELMTAKHSEPSSSLLEGAVAQDDDDDYEDITEIAVYNDTPGLSSVNSFCNSECRLDNKDADTPFSSTIADGTSLGQHGNRKRKYFDEQGQSGIRKQNNFDEQGLSGIRKRKHFGEQNCNTGISHPVSVSFTMTNAHSSEKCHELDTKNIVNEDSIHDKSLIGDSDVKENAATFFPLLRELLAKSQIAFKNSHTLMPVRQSNIESDNANQIIDVRCLDKNDEKIANKNDEPIKLGADTDCTIIEDTNTSVRDLMTVSPLTPSRIISNCNDKGPERSNAAIENIVSEVLDSSNSFLYIKCEETGNCIASVDISSTNSELDCTEGKEELVSEGSMVAFLKKIKEVNVKTEPQHFRHQTPAGINGSKSIYRTNTVRQNQPQVLITFNEKENTDLNLECEDNDTCVENGLSPAAFEVSDEQDILEDRTSIKSVEMGNQVELRKRNRSASPHDKDISNKFQDKLKCMSVIVKQLGTASVTKRNPEQYRYTPENDFSLSKNIDQFNKSIRSEEQNEPYNGINKNVTANYEEITRFSNDHRSIKRKCHSTEIHNDSLSVENPDKFTKDNTFQDDIKSDGHLTDEVNGEVDTSVASYNEEGNSDGADHPNHSVADGVVDENSTAEDGSLDEICKYCKKCNTHFTELSCYINHLILFHHPAYTRKDLTWCPFCCQNLYSSYFNSKLKRHVSFAHELDEMKCLRCELKFDTYFELHKHVNVCRARFPRRGMTQTLLYTENHQCKKCKTFHVYRPSKSSGEVLKDIVQTLPDDQEVNALKEKNKKLQGSLVHHDNVQCKLCKVVFKHITCALNHAFIVHMKDVRKSNGGLFRTNEYKYACSLCNKRHNITFGAVREIRKLLSRCENSKTASEKFSTNDKKVLSLIRGGLFKYFGYKDLKQDLCQYRGIRFCKECNIHVGTFRCSLHHMFMKHFSRGSIDDAMRSCFFNRESEKCMTSYCDTRHIFAICNILRFKHCLVFEYDGITGDVDESQEKNQLTRACNESSIVKKLHEDESQEKNRLTLVCSQSFIDKDLHEVESQEKNQLLVTPACNESSIVKKLREILVNTKQKTSSEYRLKMSVNVFAAKTKEEITEDMEYRVASINGNFVCRLCLSEYRNYSCCKSHVLTEHAVFFSYRIGSEVYTCPDCMMHFHTLHHLDVHLEQNHSIYKFTCTKCEKRFNTYKEYLVHVKHEKKHIKTNFNEEFSCKDCRLIHSCSVQNGEEELIISSSSKNETVFKNVRKDQAKHVDPTQSSSDMANHSAHEKGYSDVAFDGQQFVCLVCLEKFEDLTCCFTHVVMQHYQKDELICSICQNIVRRKAGHIAHLKDDHGLEAHYCRHCYEGFEDTFSRDNHVEQCQSQTNKIPDNVTDNVCLKCYSVHLHTLESDIKSSCSECELGFASIGCAKNHFYRKHFPAWVILASSENVFRCPCGKEVLSKSELTLHLKNDHSSEQDKTGQGETVQLGNNEISQNLDYDSYFKLKEHLNKKCVACEHVHIIASNTGQVKQRKGRKCKSCEETFSRYTCLQNHILVAHTGIFQSRQCVGCGLHFVGSHLLKSHQNEDLNRSVGNVQENEMAADRSCRRNVSLVKCDECGVIHQHQFSTEETKLKKAKSPKAIREERHRSKNSHTKILKCRNCDLVFSSHKDLLAHRKSIHRKIKDEKGVVCEVCRKKIDKSSYYSEHLKKVHCSFEFVEGELLDDFNRNFSCVYCEKTFSFYMDVQMHLRSKHFEKQLAARKHYRSELEASLVKGRCIRQCPICFTISPSIVSGDRCHMDSHFYDILGKGKSKEFVCDICGKGYHSKWHFEEHKTVHSGIRKNKCDICGKSFTYLFNLYTHSLVHKDKKEKCSVCGMKFTLPHHVRAHIKRKHPDHV